MSHQNFQELNQDLALAQAELENAIRESKAKQDDLARAEIALIQAQSAHKKAKLDEKLFTNRVMTNQEMSRNMRKEASI